jgi:hypothetical protein
MKLENQQSTITNIQFSGGRPIGGSGTNTSRANALINFSGITTGSAISATALISSSFANGAFFQLTGSAEGKFFVTSSVGVDAAPVYYVQSGSTAAETMVNLASKVNNLTSTFGIIAAASASTVAFTASIPGLSGNNFLYSSGSINQIFAGGVFLETGSFSITDVFNVTNRYIITSSTQAVANESAVESVNGSTFFIAGGTGGAATTTNIAAFLNVSSSATVQATGSGTNLQLTSSISGIAGNDVYVVSGSTTTYLSGASGSTDYPWNFPFIAGGLYVAVPGTVAVTTIDGSKINFVSASGFIPGLFQAVSSSSTALSIVALK